MSCNGNHLEICGGPGALSLFVQTASLSSGISADWTALTAALPDGWSVAPAACVAEGTTGRALSAASTASGSMTISICLNYCQGKGYQYAGIEYSGECYCDDTLQNGASILLMSPNCNMQCSGSTGTVCGGPGALSLYQNPSLAAVISSVTSAVAAAVPTLALPSGWSVASTICVAEGTSGRALDGASTSSASMTVTDVSKLLSIPGLRVCGH